MQRVGQYDVPVEAVHLAQDIERIEIILSALQRLDTNNISHTKTDEQREFGELMKYNTIALVRTWHRYAKLKLRDFLAP